MCAERERTGWGPRLIAGQVGLAHSTVHAILKRHGRSRAPRTPREAFRRYEWPCPGDLLHMDIKRYRRFRRPGHPFIKDERQTSQEINTQLGFDYCHAIIDDHSRLAYAELLPDTRAPTVTAFTERALAWFGRHGISTRRVMTDNAWTYTHNRSLKALLADRGIASEFPRFDGHLITCAAVARKDGVCAEDPTRVPGAVPPRGDRAAASRPHAARAR